MNFISASIAEILLYNKNHATIAWFSLYTMKKDRQKTVFLVEAAGKRVIKQLIIVFDDAPEENKETAEPQACEGDRR